MKNMFCLLLAMLMVFSASVVSFADEGENTSVTFEISEDTEFGAVSIDASPEEFAVFDAQLGDSIDAHFSNGYVLEDIPYYDGYYTRTKFPLLVNYPGTYIHLAFSSGDPLWKVSGCTVGDTVTLTVRERGKYLDTQNAMASVYVDDRAAFGSDEIFANFRPMTGGKLRENYLFRGASPVNNLHLRAGTVNALLEENAVAYVLDLADTEEKLTEYMAGEDFTSGYAAELFESGNAALLGLSAAYRSDAYKCSLAEGLRDMSRHTGPYYIHCTEGKDRTGFVCMLLEALAGASYDEIEYDYMKTYDNYYGISTESEPEKYEALKELRLYDMLWWLLDVPDGTVLDGMDFTKAAESYLLSAGMTESEITELKTAIMQ